MKEFSTRKRIRLENHDYSQAGSYFITVCSIQGELLFGDILVGQGLCSCRLSSIGTVIDHQINELKNRFANIKISKYIIMPNHIHMIISISEGRQEQSPCPKIGDIVCMLKSRTTKLSNQRDNMQGRKIWQYRYHDHIIRNESEYQRIWNYIDTNPQKWNEDYYYINA
jgi:putative transposase